MNYPAGMTECERIGMSGYCGPDCHVYLEGKCSEPQEMIPRPTEEEIERHHEISLKAEDYALGMSVCTNGFAVSENACHAGLGAKNNLEYEFPCKTGAGAFRNCRMGQGA